MCYDGAQCKRPFCFFAHTPKELRTVRGSSDTRVRSTTLAGKPSNPQQQQHQQQGLQAAAVAAPPAAARAVPVPAADSRICNSNSWQAYVLPESLASSDSLHDEALSPPKRNKPSRAVGGNGSSNSSSAGSSSTGGQSSGSSAGRDSTSSGSDAGGITAAAAGTSADAALLQQLKLQLQHESCSRSMQPSSDTEADTDAVWSSVQALLSCLSLEASLGQVSEVGGTGGDAQHDAPAAAAVAAGAAADACHMQQEIQPKHLMPADGNSTTADTAPAYAGRVEVQHVQQWQAVSAKAGDSSAHVPGMGGSLWYATAAAAACTMLPAAAAAAAAGFSPGSILQEEAACNSSSSNALLASSGSQPSLTGQSLAQSTAVDPADSVLDDVATLGLFGAVQPRTSSKQQQ
jgi:hypothetical protein